MNNKFSFLALSPTLSLMLSMRFFYFICLAIVCNFTLFEQLNAHPVMLDGELEDDRLSFSFQFDNDVPYSDEKYTSGIYLSTQFPSSFNFLWHNDLLDLVNETFSSHEKMFERSQVGFALFHQMYTPKRYWLYRKLETERPFASWFAGTMNLNFYSPTDVLSGSLSIGAFGNEWNMAKVFQDFAHTYISAESPVAGGWGYQISGIAAFNSLTYWKHQLISLSFDRLDFFELSSLVQVDLGMLRNSFHTGLIGQLGFKSQYLNGKPQFFKIDALDGGLLETLTRRTAAYLEVGILPQIVAYDSFVQGLPFSRNWHTVDSKLLQAHIWAGLQLKSGFLALSFFLNWKSPQTILLTDQGQTYWSFKLTTFF